VTTTGVPDDEPTGDDDDWSPLDAELVVVELLAVEEFVVAPVDVEEIPGIVWALTVARTPTLATAANATAAVSRLSSRVAASRA
jgi:hypothetical protein